MLLGPMQEPRPGQGAGDAFLQPEIPPRFQWFLNALLILAALHFLIQTAICFSCLFLLLPMSFAVSSVIPGASSLLDTTSEKNLQAEPHLGQGAARRTVLTAEQMAFLPCLQGIEDLLVSLTAAYFLVRLGLFCNLLFILPVVFFLKETHSS